VTHARPIAAAQTVPIRGDVDANVADHIRLNHAAAKERAGLLVFPELSLTVYELDLAERLAFSMTLIVGAPVRLEAQLHIGAFILSPGGAVGLYTKHQLGAFPADANPGGFVPPAENTVFESGDRNPLVRFDGHTAAVAVCADTGRSSHAQAAADRGASCYLASMFVTSADFEGEAARLQGYAAQHSMRVVLANYGGPTGGLAAAGRSAIWSETGELLAQLEEAGSGIVVANESGTGWRTNC